MQIFLLVLDNNRSSTSNYVTMNVFWLSLTSLFSYISKTNNNATLNLQHGSEIKAAPMTYDIQTWGWTTDAVAHLYSAAFVLFWFGNDWKNMAFGLEMHKKLLVFGLEMKIKLYLCT